MAGGHRLSGRWGFASGVDYASSGGGTSTHLAAEMFNSMTGAKLVHVPFKGNAEVLARTKLAEQDPLGQLVLDVALQIELDHDARTAGAAS